MGQEQQVIVDGYNVIYTDDALRRHACKDLEGARGRLIDRLCSYVKSRRIRMTVVFDGRGGLTDSEVVVPAKLQVLFSAGGQSADDVIVKTVLESGNPRQFLVVTSDQADIGSRLRPAGCQVMGSKRFLERVDKGTPGAQTPQPHPDGDTTGLGDTDYWLEQFEADPDKE
jgi:predicted RNA-binding protein with PIN domain